MQGRATIQEFVDLTGVSRTTFYNKYRWSPKYQREFDMREHEETGRIHMDREAVKAFARRKRGDLARGRSAVADQLGETTRRAGEDREDGGGAEGQP